ncbi:hypothetical protein V9K67_19790 [Paraflavisolibacter sp. H34]|uniref:hypothetical protein n=1 Tax=Huijunlia imazamoxiresistens TaxID=3127457 RepID=UPI00301B6332
MLRTTLLTVLSFVAFQASAKIWRVNNNTGISADFTTLQAAHNGAASGDTLHLEGSPSNYGGLTCTKNLVILGPGYFLDENPNTQSLAQTAKVTAVTFNVGSEGSQIMGLDFQGNTLTVQAHDIVIRRNRFSTTNGASSDYSCGDIRLYYLNTNSNIAVKNIIISQNYGVSISVNSASTGILITNNFISVNSHYGEGSTSGCLTAHANAILLIQNNIFRRGKLNVSNSSITNNIMWTGFFEGTANLVANNLAGGTQFGATNGNQASVTMTDVFVGTGTGISPDGQWKLKAGSPALGAGYGSTGANPIDAGMYSGQTPYVLAGQPPMPAIYFFENQPVGSNTDPIDVSIKVKSAGN